MCDKKTKDIKYAVKWENYSLEEMSWEPRESFIDETEKCVRYLSSFLLEEKTLNLNNFFLQTI